MAKTITEMAVEALKGGGSDSALDAAAIGKPVEGAGRTPTPQEAAPEEQLPNDDVGDFFKGVKPTESDSTTQDKSTVDLAKDLSKASDVSISKDGTVEYLTAGGKKIKVDFANKEEIRKAFKMAAGMRKAFADRDKLAKDHETLKAQHAETKKMWDTLEGLYATKGVDGVISALTNGSQTLDTIYAQRQAKEKLRAEASPTELAAMDLQERLEAERRDKEKMRKEWDEFRSSVAKEREESNLKSLESRIHPVFDEFRFDGKLGDADAEATLDEALWGQALKRLEAYPEDVDLTPEMVRKEFRTVSNNMAKVMKVQAEKKADNIVANRKVKAKENAQIETARGYQASSTQEDAAKKIRSGDLKGILSNWGTFGDLFK
jgi:hypothetical protein